MNIRDQIPTITIVVPCFNEELVIGETTARLLTLLSQMRSENKISDNSSICYVDDGSVDRTWDLIKRAASSNRDVCGIKLSRNCGHQSALLAGLKHVRGDAVISIDADLQDDINVIFDMVDFYKGGSEVVYAVRKSRLSDSFFKRWTAEQYYKLMNFMGVDLVFNHADFRLLSRNALNALCEYGEVNIFLRGLVKLIGFRYSIVEYERKIRFAGESKYPISKMLSFAWQGITSFSTVPLRFITITGFAVSLVSAVLSIWAAFSAIFLDHSVPGWASTVVPMYFIGGIQLLSLGVIGEYIAKIYSETKARPLYHTESFVGENFADHN